MGYSPTMRARIRLQQLPEGGRNYRICEADGELLTRWSPLGPIQGALDGGGFDHYGDARIFASRVDRVRAQLDADQRGRRFEAA